jgi:diguanylate cyclase (GGDEF)-like protein
LAIGPFLAVAAHFNPALMPLVLVPLIAVQQMGRLAIDRDRASRLDPLTSLANRLLLRESFDRLAARCDHPRIRSCHIALVLLDLDRFKHVNDSFGHEAGDTLLTIIADRLSTVDRDAVAGRLGGDEFAIVAHVHDVAHARRLADRVAGLIRDPVVMDGMVLPALMWVMWSRCGRLRGVVGV